jgi:hypothetical protein
VSLCDRLEAYLKARPGIWIDGRELSTVAGSYAWRTRASELRTQRGLTVENRVRTIKTASGSTVRVSEYRFVPASLLELV